ncbi:hypothetical protein D3C87_2184350 [compost metagenome]
MGYGGLDRKIHAAHVDVQHQIQLVERDGVDRSQTEDAGVDNNDVDLAQSIDG